MDNEGMSRQALNEMLVDLTNEQSDGEAEDREVESDAVAGTQEKEDADGTEEAGDDASATDAESDKKPDDESGNEDEDENPKRSRSGIDRLRRQNAAMRAELESLRSRAPRDSEVTREAITAEIGPPPREQDFAGDFLAYERALTAYELDARQAARELRKGVKRAEHAHLEAMREAAEAHQERVEEFRTKVADFDETLKSAQHLKASPTVEALVLESDNSAHLVYHLAKNPERLDRLNRMSEREAAREIGRIEARLSLPKSKTQTQAPKPVTPPKGGAAPRSQDSELDGWLKRTYRSG